VNRFSNAYEKDLDINLTSYNTIQKSESKKRVGSWLIILVLCILPIERLMFPLSLRLVDVVLIVLILYGLTEIFFLSQRIYLPLVMPISLILVVSLITTIAGFSPSNSIVAIFQEVYIYTWFIILTNVLALFNLSGLERFTKIWCMVALVEATATIMGMLSIGPNIFYTPPIGGILMSNEGFYRAVGTFINPNAAAVYLSISFFVLLATPWPTWLRSIFGIWIFIGIFATGSLGGIFSTLIATAALTVVYLTIKHQRTSAFLGIVFGVGAFVSIIALVLINILPSPSSVLGSSGETSITSVSIGRLSRSFGDRIDLIERGWSLYLTNPLGSGPNTYEVLFGVELHNDYLAFLCERGPLGLLGWLFLVGATLIRSINVAYHQKDNFQRWRMLALGAGFLVCALNAFSHEVFHFRQVWVLVAFLFATSYKILPRSRGFRIFG